MCVVILWMHYPSSSMKYPNFLVPGVPELTIDMISDRI